MTADETTHRVEECAECRGTGKIDAGNCSRCNASGQIIVHSHPHRHGSNEHDHPHHHDEPHAPGDGTPHDHSH